MVWTGRARLEFPRLVVSVVIDNCRQNATAEFPPPPGAVIQLLDSSARNSLICMGLRCGLCGLRARSRERGRSEEWPGREWNVARNGQFGRLAKSAGVRRNLREYAGTGAIRQEKTPTENGWGFDIGGGTRNRTRVRKPSAS